MTSRFALSENTSVLMVVFFVLIILALMISELTANLPRGIAFENRADTRAAEAIRQAKIEALRLAELEAARLAKLEADKQAKLEVAKLTKLEADRQAKLESARLAKLAADRQAKLEATRLAKLAADRQAEIKAGRENELNKALKNITFKTNSNELNESSYASLNVIADKLKNLPGKKLQVAGYTDNSGGANSNKALSKKRAESVMMYLISKGIDSSHISAHGYGSASPIKDNKTEKGREANRRVELHIQ